MAAAIKFFMIFNVSLPSSAVFFSVLSLLNHTDLGDFVTSTSVTEVLVVNTFMARLLGEQVAVDSWSAMHEVCLE